MINKSMHLLCGREKLETCKTVHGLTNCAYDPIVLYVQHTIYKEREHFFCCVRSLLLFFGGGGVDKCFAQH
jgi:hypothetical protein